MTDLELFISGCMEALEFTEASPDCNPLRELDPEVHDDLVADCRSFWHRFGCYIKAEPKGPGIGAAGRDFWYTRNGHGCGFWDGDWDVYGVMLTKASQNYGVFDPQLPQESDYE